MTWQEDTASIYSKRIQAPKNITEKTKEKLCCKLKSKGYVKNAFEIVSTYNKSMYQNKRIKRTNKRFLHKKLLHMKPSTKNLKNKKKLRTEESVFDIKKTVFFK